MLLEVEQLLLLKGQGYTSSIVKIFITGLELSMAELYLDNINSLHVQNTISIIVCIKTCVIEINSAYAK